MVDSTITTSNLSPRTQGCLKLAMLLITPIMLLCVLEAVGYVWEKQQANGRYAWELVASRRIEMDRYPTPGAGYTLMKRNAKYEYQDIPVVINALGLRSPSVEFTKPEGVFRILNLGDSVAMGWGVRQEESYGQILAGLLAEKLGRPVEVINAGVPGWNPENEIAYLQAVGLKFKPDLILLDFTLANDVYGSNALVENRRPAPIEWLRANTYFWPFLTIQLRWLEAKVKGETRMDVINPPHRANAYFPEDANDPKWRQIEGLVHQNMELAKGEGIPLIIVLFPLEDQVIDQAFSTLPQELFKEWTDKSDIQLVDLLLAYRQACGAKPGGRCYLEDRYLFADVWMHPSVLGHIIAAQEIQKVLSLNLSTTTK
jgi:hypothetical protein